MTNNEHAAAQETVAQLEAQMTAKIAAQREEWKPTGPARYGRYYYCIKSDLSENGEIYAHADRVTLDQGILTLWACREDGDFPNLSFAPGQWKCIFAASCMDGSAVAVDHWKGEVCRSPWD